ncbi:cation diffusion facilitator family transporter [Pelagicoccus sp. SDUM812003]|uniref:cation diffusion facilitator family transporter n=1 Tax=Pelagicoccus sp. SDUM812003 TaxID=3041267 RepID=UPI00280CBC63|nr:cation diffusion facilitator family transporter [Pelagicoccus sp. SDUM812003]MDQ8203854.1 cation diffusion facilitator family transporter [Pelagicoccus sp. SDUM812003]
MSHHHEHHNHGADDVSDAALFWAVTLNLGLSVFEFLAGLFAGSSALMADALHNTNDAAALLIALVARKVSRRGADRRYTFGYRRAELIGAMIQLTALIVVGLYLVFEGVKRFFQPEPILGGWMMIAAGVALVIDLGTVVLLWALSKGSLNVRAAFLHNLTDAGASIAVLLGGAAVYWLAWDWVDPLLTLGIAGYILYTSVNMLRRTSSILMGAVPEDLDPAAIKEACERDEGVRELHHLHVWELDESHRALEAHVVLEGDCIEKMGAVKRRLRETLQDRFEIVHCTLEFETVSERCEGLEKELIPPH